MKLFLILLRGGDDSMTNLTDAESTKYIKRWEAYLNNLVQKGKLVGGLPLQPNGRLVDNNGVREEVVLSNAGEAIGGYLIFKAGDYSQAVEMAKNCPIIEHNGNVEVREMATMEMKF